MEKTADHSRLYLLVFLGLALLTGTTVALSYLHLPLPIALGCAALIALTKCTLIATIFMHLKWERKTIYVLLFSGLFLVAFLAYWVAKDVGSPA